MTRDEEIRAAQAGDRRTVGALVEAHRGLIYREARRYHVASGAELDDLVQEATIGFLDGLRRYEFGHGTKLSTYAMLWVRARLRVFALFFGLAAGPVRFGTGRDHRRVLGGIARARLKLGHHASAGALARELGVPRQAVVDVQVRAAHRDRSLDEPMRDSRDTLGDRIADPAQPVDEALIRLEAQRRLRRALDALPPRELAVMSALQGGATLADIGRAMGVSRQRARQIEARALARLRVALVDA